MTAHRSAGVTARADRPPIVIIGAGFSGLGMAIELKRAGVHDFVLLEKAGDVGGTWRENTYPGCACDIMSLLYSFSFEPKSDWSRLYPQQEEILSYLRHCADKYGIRPHIRFGTEVTGAEYDDATGNWRVSTTASGPASGTSAGEQVLTARAVIAGMGPLHLPKIPDISGLSEFQGKVFHSAGWDHDYDLSGKRVAVIGTGASAIQFVPQIAPEVAQLHVFQRTPPWVMPKPDRALAAAEHRMMRKAPPLQRAIRSLVYWTQESLIVGFTHPRLIKHVEGLARRHLRRQVPDPGLRAKLVPDYTIGCKRILVSNDYYPTLNRENVELVTDPVKEVGKDWILTGDGTRRQVDAIIFGTGFHVADAFDNSHIIGANGLKIQDAWRDGIEAYLGMTVAGFPNLFLLLGPNSGLGHNSMVFMVQAQARYVRQCLQLLQKNGSRQIEVRPEVQREFNRDIQGRLREAVWGAGGCMSWYLDENGVNRAAWPGSTVSYWLRTRRMRRSDYLLNG
jgi:cation diffusion facilitator CzcD-associated flavoprotein CzcO